MAVGWTNVFMHLITVAGPVIGEGFATGFNGGIELMDFSLGFEAEKSRNEAVAQHAKAIIGAADSVSFKMEPLTFKKRFDASSPLIMYAIDNDVRVVTATISVIGMMQTGKPIHEPGFILVLTDGYFLEISTKLEEEGRGAAVIDTVKMSFNSIVMTYMRDTITGKDQTMRIPTLPFVYKKL
ncbi:MAG: type VI secretion system tube protein Hcp [Aquabacterium sp.]